MRYFPVDKRIHQVRVSKDLDKVFQPLNFEKFGFDENITILHKN
jgi:hypothetical protein